MLEYLERGAAMKAINTILKALFLIIKWSILATFAVLMFIVNNFTLLTEKGRKKEARRQNDEIRKLRLQKARRQKYTDYGD